MESEERSSENAEECHQEHHHFKHSEQNTQIS